MEVPSILVVCTANRCRSQMAEGWLRHLGGDGLRVCSAGTSPGGVHPLAIESMRDVGIDISTQTSDSVDRFAGDSFDLVVTLCGDAHEACPAFPSAKAIEHHPFQDPDSPERSEAELTRCFARVRDEIGVWARQIVNRLTTPFSQEQTP